MADAWAAKSISDQTAHIAAHASIRVDSVVEAVVVQRASHVITLGGLPSAHLRAVFPVACVLACEARAPGQVRLGFEAREARSGEQGDVCDARHRRQDVLGDDQHGGTNDYGRRSRQLRDPKFVYNVCRVVIGDFGLVTRLSSSL